MGTSFVMYYNDNMLVVVAGVLMRHTYRIPFDLPGENGSPLGWFSVAKGFRPKKDDNAGAAVLVYAIMVSTMYGAARKQHTLLRLDAIGDGGCCGPDAMYDVVFEITQSGHMHLATE